MTKENMALYLWLSSVATPKNQGARDEHKPPSISLSLLVLHRKKLKLTSSTGIKGLAVNKLRGVA